MTDKVRVRYAPSPTGILHVGGVRTALFNWLFARHHNGAFILRIEDTDRKRYDAEALADIMESLSWLGLHWDEGPEVGGDYGPYFQSERTELYQKHAQWLIDNGHAYKCYCTPERLAEMREQQRAAKKSGYDRHCRSLSVAERVELDASDTPYVVRLAVPLEGTTSYTDELRGEVTVDNSTIDDLVLLKSDGFPTYHLANVVDDHFMEISHIFRGDEWLSSVPKHVLLYNAFGWDIPTYVHLPLILDPSGKGKMSKRKKVDGQDRYVHLRDFRAAGYLPDALFNFLARVGWAPDGDTEIFDREFAVEKFSIASINSSPARFAYDKLDWTNGIYIRKSSNERLAEMLVPFLEEAGCEMTPEHREILVQSIPIIKERLKTLRDAAELVDFMFADTLEYDPALLMQKQMSKAHIQHVITRFQEVLTDITVWQHEAIEAALRPLVDETGLKARKVFGILRIAITGKKVSPPLFESMAILGKEACLARLGRAYDKLEESG